MCMMAETLGAVPFVQMPVKEIIVASVANILCSVVQSQLKSLSD